MHARFEAAAAACGAGGAATLVVRLRLRCARKRPDVAALPASVRQCCWRAHERAGRGWGAWEWGSLHHPTQEGGAAKRCEALISGAAALPAGGERVIKRLAPCGGAGACSFGSSTSAQPSARVDQQLWLLACFAYFVLRVCRCRGAAPLHAGVQALSSEGAPLASASARLVRPRTVRPRVSGPSRRKARGCVARNTQACKRPVCYKSVPPLSALWAPMAVPGRACSWRAVGGR